MWLYDGSIIEESRLEDYIGFVYVITNETNGRRYLGKKLLKFKRTKKVKGKKKKLLVDSDWRDYWGSNKVLIEEVKTLGPEKFKREILRLCKARGEMNYFEAKYQFDSSVLESDLWYNEWIMVKVHMSHLKRVDFSRDDGIIKLRSTGDMKYGMGIKEQTKKRKAKDRLEQEAGHEDA